MGLSRPQVVEKIAEIVGNHENADTDIFRNFDDTRQIVKLAQVKHYRNKYDDDYQAKLASIETDIEAGTIDRLTMKIGRERYQMRDTRTRQAQIDLCRVGLLVKSGRRYAVAA